MSSRRIARPSVLREIPLDRHAILEASAGTGKTFTLENLVIELLLATDTTLDRVLMVTFTEKATNELRARLRAKLQEILAGGGEPPSEDAARRGDFWTIDDVARGKLARALHAFDGTTIATIHAFCQRVLRENAFSSGRLFDEQQVDGREAFARAVREALRRDVACDAVRAVWLEAALDSGSPLSEIEDLLWKCVQARGELRPVFDASALDAAIEAFPVEDARRQSVVVEIQRWGIHGGTAKAIDWRLKKLADAVERARLDRSAPAFVQRQPTDLRKYLLDQLPSSPSRPGPTADVCAAARALLLATPPFEAALAQALLDPVRRELGRRKGDAGEYDFDDMLAFVDDVLRGPRGPRLADALRERWRYALIDEFQDTDEMQWSIFRRAFFDPGRLPGVLYLVGDPKQSIYRFRGADVHTYLRAKTEVSAAQGRPISLDQNQRSTPNALFDQDAPEPIFSGDVLYSPVACGRPDRSLVDGEGRAVPALHAFRFHSSAGDPIPLAHLGQLIAGEVHAIVDAQRPWRFDNRALTPSDVFVLTRTAREGRILGLALRESGVPHAFYKEEGLFHTDEAKEVRTLLLAIDDPADRALRLAAWLTPFFGLSLADVARVRDLPATHPLVARLHEWKALADARDFETLFETIVTASGILRREIFFAEGERELTNYLHVLEFLLEQSHGQKVALREVANALSRLIEGTRLPLDLEGGVQRLESARPAVQIMTIHKSKGLEAPIVFVAGGFSSPPSDPVRIYHEDARRVAWVGSIDDGEIEACVKREEREEEQRLMYVALTRAQGRLYVPCAVEDGTSTKKKRVRGDPRTLRCPYEPVNRRVVDMARQPPPWMSVQDVLCGSNPPGHVRRDEPSKSWTPPEALLIDAHDVGRWTALRDRHAAPVVTSYTRMRGSDRRRVWTGSTDATQTGSAEARAHLDGEPAVTKLPSARTTGVFLHEILERLPLASFSLPGFETWQASEDVSAIFDLAMATHRVDKAQRDHAERLVWAAYTTPMALPGGASIPGLGSAERLVREMEFAFPIPEKTHPSLGEPHRLDEPLAAGRGYIRGSIDLAFEHRGLTYFVDWKSDSLPSYALDAVDSHVRAHYREQAVLYTLATIKLMGVRTGEEYAARFGGLLYCFLRGLGSDGDGVWSTRPTWDDLRGWEDELRERRQWSARSDPWPR